MLHSFVANVYCALWLWERLFKGQDHHRQFQTEFNGTERNEVIFDTTNNSLFPYQ